MWNYRVVKRKECYTIDEVYYDKDGNPELMTRNPCFPCGETLEELKQDIEHMKEALTKEVFIPPDNWDIK